ncbi:MAG: type II toxin-antitoxin system Phd/YefM family antitoxin [Alphaproteobacteria bacterium]
MGVIAAGEFKAKCLHILDEVSKTREPMTVTKRGKPVARIVPIPVESGSRYGIAKGTISYAEDDDLLSTGEAWDVDQ